MEVINKLVREVEQWIRSNDGIIYSSSVDTIVVRNFERRKQLIDQLSDTAAAIKNLAAKIDAALSACRETHTREISLVSNLAGDSGGQLTTSLSSCTASCTTSWTTVSRRRAKEAEKYTSKTMIAITNEISLPAVVVHSFDEVRQNGELYYVTSADHFAFKLAGKLFHGNIGEIFTDEKQPEKIKDCRFGINCVKKNNCNYYHDPMKYPGSKDHRNFIASSWLYTPQNSIYRIYGRSRRFGSRSCLSSDLKELKDDEVEKFSDQVTHDVLCSLVLHRYISSTH